MSSKFLRQGKMVYDVYNPGIKQEREIDFWKFPYTPKDALHNIREYGLKPVLKHDWERTKADLGDLAEEALFGVLLTLTIPVFMGALAYHIIKNQIKTKREKNDN